MDRDGRRGKDNNDGHKQALATTKRNGSHDDKTTGRDNTNTDNKGADDDDNNGD